MKQMQTKFINPQKLPAVIEPVKECTFPGFLDQIQENQESIQNKILTFGGVLFRGFPVNGHEDFNAVIDALGFGRALNYVGGDTPRDKVKGKVYTSTEAPPSLLIPLHNEMSFIKHYPRHIYFYCDIPPKAGGETIIGDARSIYRSIDPKIRDRFAKNGLRYISNFYGKSFVLDFVNRFCRAHKTWMEAFETGNKAAVEKACQDNQFGYRWGKKDWLQVIYDNPAIIAHPNTGERVWFNQAHLYDYNPRLIGFWNWIGTKLIYCRKDTVMHEIYYGDGSKVSRSDLYHVMDVLQKETIKFPWRKGDVMVLDNVLAMHGRAPFRGSRRILASLTR